MNQKVDGYGSQCGLLTLQVVSESLGYICMLYSACLKSSYTVLPLMALI